PMIFTNVDLPAPLRPRRAIFSPARTSNVIPSRTRRVPSWVWYSFTTSVSATLRSVERGASVEERTTVLSVGETKRESELMFMRSSPLVRLCVVLVDHASDDLAYPKQRHAEDKDVGKRHEPSRIHRLVGQIGLDDAFQVELLPQRVASGV